MIFIAGTFAHQVRDVGRSCGPWLVLQPSEIRLDFVLIDSDLDLVWEGDVDFLKGRVH